MKCSLYLAVAAVCLIASAQPRAAEPPPPAEKTSDGVMNAAALKPIPAGPIAVKPWDNSDANMALARIIEDQLKAKGYRLDPASPLVLSFETEADKPSAESDPRRRLIEVQGSTGSSHVDDDTRVKLNLYSTETGGVFNEREGANDAPRAPAFRLKITLDGQAQGQTQATGRLWQGEASARLNRGDEQALYRAMVVPLVESIGKTVRAEPFGLE